MTKIQVKPNCSNSPKNEFIRDFNIAFMEGNYDFILANVSDDIDWCIYGDLRINGIEAFKKELEKMKQHPSPKELIIDSVISHGSEGMASGLMVMEDKTYAFCDVYKFRSAGSRTIKTLRSFIVKI